MKEIRKDYTVAKIYYEANDGTLFNEENECKKYEESALGILNYKVSLLRVGEKDISCWDVMYGYEDNICIAFKPESHADCDTILQWYLAYNDYLVKGNNKDKIDEVAGTLMTAWHENDIIFFGLNCDNEPYIINTRNNIIDNLKNFDKHE